MPAAEAAQSLSIADCQLPISAIVSNLTVIDLKDEGLANLKFEFRNSKIQERDL